MQSRVDEYYASFAKAVSRGRGIPIAQVRDEMGQGRVLGAAAALAAKMVDGIFTFDEVLTKMQKDRFPKQTVGASQLRQARHALELLT